MKSVLRKAGRFFAADKKRWNFFWLNCLKQPVRRSERPSSVNEVDSFPPRGSLDVRQTIFASLCASTMRQGEAESKAKFETDLYRLAKARHFPQRGKQEIASKAKIKHINDTLQSVMKQAKPAQRGKQGITSKAKIKNINDTLQSVMKQAKPARRGKQGAAQRSV